MSKQETSVRVRNNKNSLSGSKKHSIMTHCRIAALPHWSNITFWHDVGRCCFLIDGTKLKEITKSTCFPEILEKPCLQLSWQLLVQNIWFRLNNVNWLAELLFREVALVFYTLVVVNYCHWQLILSTVDWITLDHDTNLLKDLEECNFFENWRHQCQPSHQYWISALILTYLHCDWNIGWNFFVM